MLCERVATLSPKARLFREATWFRAALPDVSQGVGAHFPHTEKRMPLSRRFFPALAATISACGVLSVPAFSQSISIAPVSPATSIVQSGQADVHLRSSAASTTSSTKQPSWAKFASGSGTILFLGAGTLLPLIEDGRDKKDHSLRTADSLVTATLITEGLKRIVREKRPDNNERNSFPSGHATAAFAVATMQAHFHPNQAILWYAGASLIAYSRVRLRRHYTQDVLAGAAIGIVTARLEIASKRGFLFSPFIQSKREGGGTGVSISKSF